ncbi:hypothetical protein PG994_007860 [Apiospora phragmitis]|uniref:Uncharacterized protein n=1 Tax=Apiospora phragmitis TaxID=2905665 RepID=A0ABR1URE9_9PEZI
MVEGGENDSFDTSIVNDPYEDVVFSTQPSQISSSQGLSLGSQDSIRDFANDADEDEVILRAPFQPSLASTRHTSRDQDQTPVPEFFMPKLEVESPRRSVRSSRTIQPEYDDRVVMRRRINRQPSDAIGPTYQRRQAQDRRPQRGSHETNSLWDKFAASTPTFVFNVVSWCLSVLGAGMMVRNMVTNSISTSLSPLCRIPGASMLDLPFCPDLPTVPGSGGKTPVEFDELMNVQSDFEKVLEDSARGVSLPMEMKRAEASVRDLRTLVKYSDLPAREELVYEFDGYIDNVRIIATDLQTFNTHVGSAVDSVISINRWTSRYIDSIAAEREANDNMLARWSGWLFSPFQPQVFDERMLLDKYVEHTSLVSEKIANLIVEAQATLRVLSQAENNLQLINEHVVRSGNEVKAKKSEVFWDLWTLVGANNKRLNNLKAQLGLLKAVEGQRTSAREQLIGLVHDLGDIQTKLSDLRDRVVAPELLADQTSIPLSVHIETINAGVERLESARSRIRAEENDRIQQALSRARDEERLIDG